MNDINTFVKKWQRKLGLLNWKIGFELVNRFKRTDNYPQTGDIKVNTKNKSAMILILKTTKNQEKIVVHELMHLLLWDWDHKIEKLCKNRKEIDKHLENLEMIVEKFTNILTKEK